MGRAALGGRSDPAGSRMGAGGFWATEAARGAGDFDLGGTKGSGGKPPCLGFGGGGLAVGFTKFLSTFCGWGKPPCRSWGKPPVFAFFATEALYAFSWAAAAASRASDPAADGLLPPGRFDCPKIMKWPACPAMSSIAISFARASLEGGPFIDTLASCGAVPPLHRRSRRRTPTMTPVS